MVWGIQPARTENINYETFCLFFFFATQLNFSSIRLLSSIFKHGVYFLFGLIFHFEIPMSHQGRISEPLSALLFGSQQPRSIQRMLPSCFLEKRFITHRLTQAGRKVTGTAAWAQFTSTVLVTSCFCLIIGQDPSASLFNVLSTRKARADYTAVSVDGSLEVVHELTAAVSPNAGLQTTFSQEKTREM